MPPALVPTLHPLKRPRRNTVSHSNLQVYWNYFYFPPRTVKFVSQFLVPGGLVILDEEKGGDPQLNGVYAVEGRGRNNLDGALSKKSI